MSQSALERSRALWNRSRLNLASDDMIAQVVDRGEPEAWRELYRLAREDPELRRRIKRIVLNVPVSMPHFWLAALAALGEHVDFDARLPEYDEPPG